MTVLAIINPAAGGGRCGPAAAPVLARLRGELSVDVVETRYPGHASELAADALAAGRRSFIAVGGDGTTHEVLNGLLPAALEQHGDSLVTLGFLPLGTGNSFLRDFTDRGASYCIECLLQKRRRKCDVVRIAFDDGVLFFLNILSLGFVADVCTVANRRFKPLGAAGYGLGVLWTTASLSSRRVAMRLDEGSWQDREVVFVSLSNSRFTGGRMMMAPEADTADGLVDVIVAERMSRLQLLRAFPKIFAGTHPALPFVSTARARKVEFECGAPLDLMIDGEVVRRRLREVEVLPRAIEVFA